MHEILQVLIQHGYTLLFFWVFAERIGIPIPAILSMVAAGVLIEMEYMQPIHALFLAFMAVMLAGFAWYFLGRYRGSHILTFLCRISFETDARVRKTENLFEKHGPATLLFAKFVPGLRNLMVSLAGLVRMPPRTFVVSFKSTGVGLRFGKN